MFDAIRNEFFPYTIIDGVIAEACTETSAFWQQAGKLMDTIFPPYDSLGAYGYSVPEQRKAKSQLLSKLFSQTHHEYHLFKTASNEYIGYSYGDMRDAQTYFMASTGILAEYRQLGIYTNYLKQLLKYLYALGYERVISNHHPNNRNVLIAKLKLGFSITAVNLDERWGAQVELTYHFHEDRRRAYQRAFSMEERPIPINHV